jgi:UDP-N-acetylglucosamine 2-epimerase
MRRSNALERLGVSKGAYALMTVHRQANTLPESLPGLVSVLEAIDEPLVVPLHPRTEAALSRRGLLERAERAAIITQPLGYLDFTALLASARVCLTDSGGVQKEAYLHSVPCITLRDSSEWVETIELGWNRLSALDPAAVVAAMADLRPPAEHPPLYGDGHASQRIAELVAAFTR